MEPLSDKLRDKIPPLYRTRAEADPMVWVRFFSPVLNWRWYVIEAEQVDRVLIFYGWMAHAAEPAGRLIRSDLASMRAYFGIVIERDTDFVPCPLSQVQQVKGE